MMSTEPSHSNHIGTYELQNLLQEFIPDHGALNLAYRESLKSNARMMEPEMVQGLRNGDEAAFSSLLDRYHTRLIRVARIFVTSQAVAEEVVQETWLAVLKGIDRFEGRSSLKTWIFRILTNRAKSKGQREHRYVSFSDVSCSTDGETVSTMEPERFHPSGPLKNHWAIAPTTWEENTPERLLLSKESRVHIEMAIQSLPSMQRQVMILRDIEGFDSEETCEFLHLTPTNQRVLLHRARSKVRVVLTQYLQGSSPNA